MLSYCFCLNFVYCVFLLTKKSLLEWEKFVKILDTNFKILIKTSMKSFSRILISVVVGSCLLVVIDLVIYSQSSVSLTTFAPKLLSITSFSSGSYHNHNYYSNSNRIYIPKTWQELNSQLFCSIKTESTTSTSITSSILNLIWSPTNNKDDRKISETSTSEKERNKKAKAYNRVIKDLYDIQFNDECDTMFDENPHRKYFIMDHIRGLGYFATMQHWWLRHFSHALILNRTFLFHGDWFYARNCSSNYNRDKNKNINNNIVDTEECYFMPVSNCNATEILEKYKKNNPELIYYVQRREMPRDTCPHPIRGAKKTFGKYKIIYLSQEIWCDFRQMNVDVDDMKKYLFPQRRWNNINFEDWRAIFFSFMLRFKPYIKDEIESIIDYSIENSLKSTKDGNINSLFKYNIENTIGMPIRRSDKCHESVDKHWGHAEMHCFEIFEYLLIAQELREIIPNIDTIIVTSESQDVINIFKYEKNFNSYITNIEKKYYNNDDDDGGGGNIFLRWDKWNFIFNLKDVMPNTGQIDHLEKYQSSLFNMYDIMLSQLSTISLQMHAKYYIMSVRSNWIHGIWVLANRIANFGHCNFITKQLNFDFDADFDINTVNTINIDKSKDDKKMKKYNLKNRQCIHLDTGDRSVDATVNKLIVGIQQGDVDNVNHSESHSSRNYGSSKQTQLQNLKQYMQKNITLVKHIYWPSRIYDKYKKDSKMKIQIDRWNWYYFRYNKLNYKHEIRNDWSQPAHCERNGIGFHLA